MRRRNMYYATGMPGWMRLGYSPGWVGRSASGLGPCAEYLRNGQWPNQAMAEAAQGWGRMAMDPAQEKTMLETQVTMLEEQLQALRQRLTDLQGDA